jgi:hypothetical protein
MAAYAKRVIRFMDGVIDNTQKETV